MPVYRLIIERHARLLGHFDASSPWALDALLELAASLPASAGYRLQAQVSRGERRVLESTPGGVRVLASEQLFEPVALDLTMEAAQA